MSHDYLVLALLFLLPGAVFWFLRPDLRGLMGRTALAALPFATTEWLFYPEYWAPKFLFDLADRIGFGIEDVLLIVGLAAFSSSAYAVAFRRTVVPLASAGNPWRRAVGAVALVLAVAALLLAVGVSILYASVVAMLTVTGLMLVARPDLRVPAPLGALVTTAIYFGLCLLFEALVPGPTVDSIWRPSLLLRGRLLGVPLDEVLYGFGSGLAATVIPPWAFGLRFVPRVRAARPAR